MTRPAAGSIVVVDWRGGARPKESSKLRPAIVVEDSTLFPDEYPNMVVVPLTSDEGLAHQFFAEPIDPDENNGVEATCWALAHHITSVSLQRVKSTDSRVTTAQLVSIRRRVALAVGAS